MSVVPHDDNSLVDLWVSLQQAGVLTPTSLALPPGVSDEELLSIGRMLAGIKRFQSFALGDLLVYAKANGGDELVVEVMEVTGMAHQTQENMMSVCRSVRPSVRRAGLSFGHHDTVRALTPNEQRHWLAEADKNGWTRQQLRDEIFGTPVLPPAVSARLPDVVKDALAGARPMMDGWLISRDSYTRLLAAVNGGNEDDGTGADDS